MLFHIDIQESSPKRNAKFNFLGIIWENKMPCRVLFWAFSEPTIQNFHSSGNHGATSGIYSEVRTYDWEKVTSYEKCSYSLTLEDPICLARKTQRFSATPVWRVTWLCVIFWSHYEMERNKSRSQLGGWKNTLLYRVMFSFLILRYTNVELKTSLYVYNDIKIIFLKFHIPNPKTSRVIRP